MSPLHYPDLPRCEQLTKSGFPETERSYNNGNIVFTKSLENTWSTHNVCVCPSVSELLDVIPSEIVDTRGRIQRLEIYNNSEYWYVCYCALHDLIQHVSGKISDDTLANALSDLVLWLISQGYRFDDGKLIK